MATIQLTPSTTQDTQTLQVGGYVPLRWIAPLKPVIPWISLQLQVNLPAHGLTSVKSYLAELMPTMNFSEMVRCRGAWLSVDAGGADI